MTGINGRVEEERIDYRRSMLNDYVWLGLLLPMPVWMPLVMWWRGLLKNPLMIAAGFLTYAFGMWQEYWCLFKTPQALSLTASSITFKYYSKKKPPRTWSLANVTAELRPRSFWRPPSRKALALTNMETDETVVIDVEMLTTRTWIVIHDLEDRAVQVTLLTRPLGRDPREDDESEEGSTFLP